MGWFVALPWWMWVFFGVILLPVWMAYMLFTMVAGPLNAYVSADPKARGQVNRAGRTALIVLALPLLLVVVPLYLWMTRRPEGIPFLWVYGSIGVVGALGSLEDSTVPQPVTAILVGAAGLIMLVAAFAWSRMRATATERPSG